jgi:NitT/TauT family transport system substrate-binding protein
LPQEVIDGAWSRMRITYDPISSSLFKSAEDAYTAGFLKEKPNLSGIYDLTLLNEVLKEKGLPPVK